MSVYLQVVYGEHYGWISERMRGGGEEVMVERLQSATPEMAEALMQATVAAVKALGVTRPDVLNDRIVWDDQPSLTHAMARWEEMVTEAGAAALLRYGEYPTEPWDEYLALVSSMDRAGEHPWTVETDMQLTEMLSKCAVKEGVTPQVTTPYALPSPPHRLVNLSQIVLTYERSTLSYQLSPVNP